MRHPSNMSSRARRVLRVGSWVAATAIAVLLLRAVDLTAVGAILRRAHIPWIGAALLGNLLILALWTEQWRALMPAASALSFRRMLPLVGMTSFAGNAIPATGQIATVLLLSSEPNVSRTTAVSVLALDQVVEGITKLLVVGLGALLIPLPGWMRPTLALLTIAVLVLIVVLVALAHQSRWLQQFAQALESLRDRRRLAASVAWCIGSKLSEFLAIVAVQLALGTDVPLAVTLVVLAAVQLGTMVPLAPANIGTYEACAMTVYREAGLSVDLAMSIAVLQHVCLLLSTAGVGYLFTLRSGWARMKQAGTIAQRIGEDGRG